MTKISSRPCSRAGMMLFVLSQCLLFAANGICDESGWRKESLTSEASLRAVAVAGTEADERSLICVAGAGPEVWLAEDASGDWRSIRPDVAGVSDYRSVAIAGADVIILASAGTPAVIVRSDDRGKTWSIAHRDDRPGAFLDGLRMRTPLRGNAFGDPIEGKFPMLQTNDGGRTWLDMRCSVSALPGEAGFAASNGSVALFGQGGTLVGLGGRTDQGPARVLRTVDSGVHWSVAEIAGMPAGPSQGVFAIDLTNGGFGVAVGGDYQRVESAEGNVAVTDDGGQTWRRPAGNPPRGFRSAVIRLDNFPDATGCWLTTGPSGTDISDDGESWRAFTDEGFHALAEMPDGKPIAIGSGGRVAFIETAP